VSNLRLLVKALVDFGFGELDLKVSDFQQLGQVIQLGREPIRVDLLTSVRGAEFAESFDSRLTVEIDDQPVAVIGLAELKRVKAATGRLQDLADLERLG